VGGGTRLNLAWILATRVAPRQRRAVFGLRGVVFRLDAFRLRQQTEPMNFAFAPSNAAKCACVRVGADARALAVVATAMMQDVVLPPRSPGPGHP
jgi:hypothetical protein